MHQHSSRRLLTWREISILARDCPYVSWKWTAIFSLGTTDMTASSIGMTVPIPYKRSYQWRIRNRYALDINSESWSCLSISNQVILVTVPLFLIIHLSVVPSQSQTYQNDPHVASAAEFLISHASTMSRPILKLVQEGSGLKRNFPLQYMIFLTWIFIHAKICLGLLSTVQPQQIEWWWKIKMYLWS